MSHCSGIWSPRLSNQDLCLTIGTNRQDGLGAYYHKQPPESQCLRATTQKHNLLLYVQFGSVGRLSCLSSGTYMTGQLLPSWNIASQHGREYWAAHTTFFKFLPQRDIHHFHPDSTGQSKSWGREVQWYRVSRWREKPRNCEQWCGLHNGEGGVRDKWTLFSGVP